MSDTVETIRIILQLVFGIAAVLWFPIGAVYRSYHSRRLGVGFWNIDTPLWHKIVFWPIILGLFLLFTWALFF
jgi:hypothetical protein